MKPIAIFQHDADVPPAFFETWLQSQSLPYAVVRIDAGDAVPRSVEDFAGLCFMGGRMSVNDPLPWIDEELRLICAADRARLPVIGHCLGGQLLAKALGGSVRRNPHKELGWQSLRISDSAVAAEWLGDALPEALEWFQWHGDTFELPPGARNFLESDLCARQAYVIERDGYAHLGMQFHCEMTPALVIDWSDDSGRAEIDNERHRTGGPGVQSVEAMRTDLERRTSALNSVAARLYARWARGLQAAQHGARRRPGTG